MNDFSTKTNIVQDSSSPSNKFLLKILSAQFTIVIILGFSLSLSDYGAWGVTQFEGLSLLSSTILMILMPILGFVGIIESIRCFKRKQFKALTFLLLIVSLCCVSFYPSFFVSKRIAGLFNQTWTSEYQDMKTSANELQVEKFNQLTETYKKNHLIAKEISASHYKYYSEVLNNPVTLIENYNGGTFTTENNLKVEIFFNTNVVDFMDPVGCNKNLSVCTKQKEIISSIMNESVILKLPGSETFDELYITRNDLVSKVANLNDENNTLYHDPKSAVWEDNLRIPVNIYYKGESINDQLK